jgi:hypothetical protein
MPDQRPRQRTDELPGNQERQEVRRGDEGKHCADERDHERQQPRASFRLGRRRVRDDRGRDEWDQDHHHPPESCDGQAQLDRRAPAKRGRGFCERGPRADRDGCSEHRNGDRTERPGAAAQRDQQSRAQDGQQRQDDRAHRRLIP